jgi:hypothetical protein
MFASSSTLLRNLQLRLSGARLAVVGSLVVASVTLPAAPAFAATVTSGAQASPFSIAQGSSTTITANFTASVALSNVVLDVEVRDGQNNPVMKKLFSGYYFNPGQLQTVSVGWQAPSYAGSLGAYTVQLGVFSSDFSQTFGWNASATVLYVVPPGGSAPAPAPPGQFSMSASASPNQLAPGAATTITGSFTSPSNLSNVVPDIEVRNSGNGQVFKQLFSGQSFSAGQNRSFTANWTVPSSLAAGTYTIMTGVFSPDFATSYGWNPSAGSITVSGGGGGAPPVAPPGVTGTSYYVDCSAGNDGAAGTSQSQPWASVNRANQANLQPGDGLFFKRACSWTGPLNARWSGTSSAPVTIGAYGSGTLPEIQNGSYAQIEITGNYQVFDSIWVRSNPDSYDPNCSSTPIGDRIGFDLSNGASYNVIRNAYLSDLAVGIQIGHGSHNNSIQRNELAHNIMLFSTNQYTNDGGASGLVIYGDYNDIGWNLIHDSVACSTRYGTIGHGIDLENGQSNVFHDNKSWNNGSNFAELGSYVTTNSAQNNVFAYNISIGEGFTNHTNSYGTHLYNNVFYFPAGGILTCASCSSVTLENNIFVANTGIYGSDGAVSEHNNLFFNPAGGVYNTQGLSGSDLGVDPQFVNPGGGDFHLQNSSPAINAGTMDSVNAGFNTDYAGNPVPQGGVVDMGAFEMR